MAEYEATRRIDRRVAQVFDFVADVANLPSWSPDVRRAQLTAPDEIDVEGSAGGHEFERRGLFRVDADQLRLEWGSEGDGHYSGWLQVASAADDDSACSVTLHLSFLSSGEGTWEERHADEREGERVHAEEAIEEALDRLAAAVPRG